MEKTVYIRRCLEDHLLDTKTYRRITKQEALTRNAEIVDEIKHLMEIDKAARERLPLTDTQKYFARGLKQKKGVAKFYANPKIHKKPIPGRQNEWPTRPVVATCSSPIEILSKWLDDQLQQVLHLCPSYLKDGYQLIRELSDMAPLPTNAKLVTADASSMYTNIDTDFGIAVIDKWLDRHKQELPYGFPTKKIVKGLRIVMKNTVFVFDDTYWLQLKGTAMGTSVAVTYATIFFSYWEEIGIIPHFGNFLVYYRRFIDDMLSIIIYDPEQVENLGTKMNSFGPTPEMRLSWEMERPATSVNFLDLTISINTDGKIEFKTYQKPRNLYLYLPPSSAHPPSVFKGTVFGQLRHFWKQNSNPGDFQRVTREFYQHLLRRGHQPEPTKALFMEAAHNIENTIDNDDNTAATRQTKPRPFILHQKYHPSQITRQALQALYKETLGTLQNSNDATSKHIGSTELIIAYNRAENLRDMLTSSGLNQPDGNRVSDIINRLPTTEQR